jgi:hypothetical protein
VNQKQRSKDRCRRFPCCISLTRLCLRGFTALQTLFTGTVAKVASLIAIVIGGYQFAHGEPGGKKALAGVAARTGIFCLKCWLPWALSFPESKMAFFAIFTIYDDSKIVGLAICADESNPDRGRDSCHWAARCNLGDSINLRGFVRVLAFVHQLGVRALYYQGSS